MDTEWQNVFKLFQVDASEKMIKKIQSAFLSQTDYL